jgi:hypothetical protein
MQSKSSQWLDNSSKSLLLVLLAKERAERTQTKDFNAEEGELLEEENEQEEVFEMVQIHKYTDQMTSTCLHIIPLPQTRRPIFTN